MLAIISGLIRGYLQHKHNGNQDVYAYLVVQIHTLFIVDFIICNYIMHTYINEFFMLFLGRRYPLFLIQINFEIFRVCSHTVGGPCHLNPRHYVPM